MAEKSKAGAMNTTRTKADLLKAPEIEPQASVKPGEAGKGKGTIN